MSQKKSSLIPVLCILTSMIVIQAGASLAKTLFPMIGPGGTTSLRLAFSALILFFSFRPWRASVREGLTRQHIGTLAVYGIFLGGMNFLFYISISKIPLGIAVALEFTGPLAVALFASKKLLDFIWVLLAVTGLILLLPLHEFSAQLDMTGIFCALAAGACWAGYILYGQKASLTVNSGFAVSIGMIFAAMTVVPIGVIQIVTGLFSMKVIPIGIAVAILSSALPYSLEMIALKGLSRSTFSILMSLEPAFATLSGYIFLSEKLTSLQFLAIFFVIAASAGSSLTSRPKKVELFS
jgi:inner membrane transporter RhtA